MRRHGYKKAAFGERPFSFREASLAHRDKRGGRGCFCIGRGFRSEYGFGDGAFSFFLKGRSFGDNTGHIHFVEADV